MLLKCDAKLRRGEDYKKLFPCRLKHEDSVHCEDDTEVNNNTEDTLAVGKLKTDHRVTFSENIVIGEVNDDSKNEKEDLVKEEENIESQFQPWQVCTKFLLNLLNCVSVFSHLTMARRILS